MAQEKRKPTFSLEDFNSFIDLIIEMQNEQRWRFIFQKKYTSVSLDKPLMEKKMTAIGMDKKLFKPMLGQVTNMITAIIGDDKETAMPWFIDNYGENEVLIEQKFKIVEEKIVNDEIKNRKKLYDKCVFNFLKSFAWGIEEKFLDPDTSDETYKVGTINLIIQENNPISIEEIIESRLYLTLTLNDVLALIQELNQLKEKLQ